MAQVELENVTKVYPGGIVAVKDASLTIRDEEFLVLVGPSGCGKSTTLRMIAGLEEVTEGTIRIGDRVVNDIPPKDRDIAMVFQNYALYPHMTVYKNLAFGLKLRKYPKEEIDGRVRDAAQILGINDLLDRKPKELSGGQRQRVAVGRAIVRKPAAFLFDEPLSNLDAKLRVEMRAELNKLHTRLLTTMIYVTHDQVEAMTLGDRIVLLKDGVIQQVAPPLKLYNEPCNKFVAGFIGTPPMNFFEGEIAEDGDTYYFTDGDMRIRVRDELKERVRGYVGKPITFGIRPENLYDKAHCDGVEPGGVLNCKIDVVEPLGDEMIIYLSTKKQSMLSKLQAHRMVRPGEEMEVVVDLEKVHLFDEREENMTLTKEVD